jgi:alkane 1-monooxygenase
MISQFFLILLLNLQVVTWSVVPVQLAVISYGCYWVTTHEVTNFEFFGMAWAVGIYAGGIGITVGHELCHKNSAFERFCGRLLMCSTSYGHFYIEHTMGHHKMVATDNDPATARCGENFYAFLPRVVFGELASAIHLENDRIHNKGLPFWHHEIPYYFGASIAMCYAFGALFGPEAKSMFLAQSAVAILLFESVNYLEHYGLERRRDAKTGEYETVKPQHSWDSPAKVTNMFLFKLQRHADHHAHAGKRFQTLQAYDSSPQLPSGYTTMIFLALFPPLWFAVMNPRLEAFRKTQKGQVWRFGPTPKAD